MLAISIFVLLSSTAIINGDRDKFVQQPKQGGKTALTAEDFKRAELNADQINNKVVNDSGMYQKDVYQGDMLGESKFETGMYGNAIRGDHFRWPNGRIPYEIDPYFDEDYRATMAAAVADYNKYTCVRYVPKTDADTDYVSIVPYGGCSSYVGKIGGEQTLTLGSNCNNKGIVIHEMMHAAGFEHEQSRSDRDKFVTIFLQNVRSGQEDNFELLPTTSHDLMGIDYDYSSLMHYSSKAFSRNDDFTIIPKQEGVEIGQRKGFSDKDIQKINLLYKCDGNTVQPITTVTATDAVDKYGDCGSMSSLCDLSTAVKSDCAKTCNSPSKPKCSDSRNWCNDAQRLRLCTVKIGKSNCPKACGSCS